MAKQSAARQGPNMLLIGGIILVALIAVVFVMRGTGGGTAATMPVELSEDDGSGRAQGVTMGDPNAPVELYEFADYQCPACAQFSTFAHPLIYSRLVDEGIIRFTRYDFPIVTGHPHAFLAARAARCAADQDQYWEYHDVLYGQQPSWSVEQSPPVNRFIEFAGMLDMDEAAFRSCVRSDQYADEVTRNMMLGQELGVTGTPTLMMNGELIRVRDYNDLEQRVMEAAGRLPEPEATDEV